MRHIGIFGAIVCCAVLAQAQERSFLEQVEADWLIQEQYRYGDQSSDITPQSDAAGACDGVKNGQWGFHTEAEDSPWWQVDLEDDYAIARVVIWNRCEGVAPRASRLKVL